MQGRAQGDDLEELADVFEVVTARVACLGVTLAQVQDAADRKRVERGGSDQRLWLRLAP